MRLGRIVVSRASAMCKEVVFIISAFYSKIVLNLAFVRSLVRVSRPSVEPNNNGLCIFSC